MYLKNGKDNKCQNETLGIDQECGGKENTGLAVGAFQNVQHGHDMGNCFQAH
jgi:hypothetical protein